MPDRDSAINDLNVAKLILCNSQMLTPEMCIRIGQAITSALALLKEQENKKLIDADKLREKLGFVKKFESSNRIHWDCRRETFYSLDYLCDMFDKAIEELVLEGR